MEYCERTEGGVVCHAVSTNGAKANGVGTGEYDYDLFTIGGGSAGVRAARVAAGNYGARVALAELPLDLVASDERGGLGGTCVLRGCVPKKHLVYGGHYAVDFKESEGYGWRFTEPPRHDWQAMMDAKNKELHRLSEVYKKNLSSAGVEFMTGRATIVDEHTVSINGETHTAKYILIATGGSPSVPPIEGKEHTMVSDHILVLPKRPEKLVIVGGGYIAAEQACIYNNFGSEVHVLFRGEHMMAGFDPECGAHIEEQYQKQGIELHANYSPTKVTKGEDGKLTVVSETKQGEKLTLDNVDYILMATGRKPKTAGLGLDKVGVELDDKGGVKVDEYSQSSVPSIYAIGDVTNRIPLTPVARMEGQYFARHLFDGDDIKPDYANVAKVVFSSPQFAAVGMTEPEAIEDKHDVDIYTSSVTDLKSALTGSELKGMIKVVVDANTDRVLGIHIVGPEAAEILQGFAAAMKAGLTKRLLDETVGLHPTSAEELTTIREPSKRIRNKQPQKVKA